MDVGIWVLLGIAMAAALLTAVGMLFAPDTFERLQYMSPVASVGVVAVAAAVVLRESVSPAGIKAMLVALIVVVMNPILTHATARATRIHEHGQWQPQPEERIPIEEPGEETR